MRKPLNNKNIMQRAVRGQRRLNVGCVLALSVFVGACQTPATDVAGSGDSAEASQFNAELGARYLQRGELDQARLKLEKALEQDNNNSLAHISYARLQQEIDEPELAKSHFKRALELNPDDAEHLSLIHI